MRYVIVVLWMLFFSATSALAQVSISIGINLPLFPTLVQVPGYPVYYAPRLNSNFFFYGKRSIDAAIDDGGGDEVMAKPIGGSLPNTRAGGLRSRRRFGQWGVC